MADIQCCEFAASGAACLEKGRSMQMVLQLAGVDLLLLLTLEALQWTM